LVLRGGAEFFDIGRHGFSWKRGEPGDLRTGPAKHIKQPHDFYWSFVTNQPSERDAGFPL
jgi:hypothetical protein